MSHAQSAAIYSTTASVVAIHLGQPTYLATPAITSKRLITYLFERIQALKTSVN
jgi:hypothetical protein